MIFPLPLTDEQEAYQECTGFQYLIPSELFVSLFLIKSSILLRKSYCKLPSFKTSIIKTHHLNLTLVLKQAFKTKGDQ